MIELSKMKIMSIIKEKKCLINQNKLFIIISINKCRI